jgi:uncharacterized protein (TIGR03663 family)
MSRFAVFVGLSVAGCHGDALRRHATRRGTVRFVGLIVAAAGAALGLRLPRLNLRPMHVDEAVHACKFDTLWQTGQYHYDLQEYHGPTLYYFALPAMWLSRAKNLGETEAATFRITPVVFGVGLVLLLLLVADGLGRPAAVCAGVLTAISPAMLFYSRYYIQEMLLVFFTFLVIAAGWRYVRSRRIGWAILAGLGVGLMHATKETSVIALGSMLLALIATLLWGRHGRQTARPWGSYLKPKAILAGLLSASTASVLLFSGLFTNLAGPLDSIRAFATYFQRAGEGGIHEQPWHYYLHMLTFWRVGRGPVFSEVLIVALSIAGILAILRHKGIPDVQLPLLRFLTVYTVVMTVVYSAIPYKTPWCLLSLLHGMILLAGVGAVALVQRLRHFALQAVVAGLLIAAAVQLSAQARRSVSQKYCAYPGNPYVYATTLHGVTDLADQLERLAGVHPAGHRMLVKVMVENPWPLPWYLRRFERVGYWEDVPPEPDADVILASHRFRADLEAQLKGDYQVNTRGLRRDERLLVYIEKSLWDVFVREQTRDTDVR